MQKRKEKDIMKKITAMIVLAALLLISGCNSNNNTPVNTQGTTTEATTTTTAEEGKVTDVVYSSNEEDTTEEALEYIAGVAPLFRKYLEKRMSVPLIMETTSISGNGVVHSGLYFKDENNIATCSTNDSGAKNNIIYSTNGSYIIEDSTKTVYDLGYTESYVKDIISQYKLKMKANEVKTSKFESSVEEYDGVTYNCETISDGSSQIKYYFDTETDDLRYLISGDNVTKITRLENNVPDESYFVVPDDYQKVNFQEYLNSLEETEKSGE